MVAPKSNPIDPSKIKITFFNDSNFEERTEESEGSKDEGRIVSWPIGEDVC